MDVAVHVCVFGPMSRAARHLPIERRREAKCRLEDGQGVGRRPLN